MAPAACSQHGFPKSELVGTNFIKPPWRFAQLVTSSLNYCCSSFQGKSKDLDGKQIARDWEAEEARLAAVEEQHLVAEFADNALSQFGVGTFSSPFTGNL